MDFELRQGEPTQTNKDCSDHAIGALLGALGVYSALLGPGSLGNIGNCWVAVKELSLSCHEKDIS